MTDPRRIVIVGGGVAGLSAAYAAVRRGRELGVPLQVTLLEGSTRFGGCLVTDRRDGFVLDGGPDSWVANKPHATALARDLGLSASLVGTNPATRRFYVAWDDHLHAVPEGLVLGVPTRLGPLARSRLFSWRGKARMALEPLVPARRFDGDDDESIAAFATRRLGREASDRLVAPLLGGISSGDASEISVRASFPQLVAMEQRHGSLVRGMRAARRGTGATHGAPPSAFVSLRGGVEELVQALSERLREEGVILRSGARLRAMSRGERGWTLDAGESERIEADAVLLAIPAYAAAELIAPTDADASRTLGSIRYGSTATVFLAYRRAEIAHPLDGVGFVVPRSLGRPILASTWVSSKWDARAPEGSALVRVFVGGEAGDAVLSQDDGALTRLARSELAALMGLDAEPVFSRVFRFERASAQMGVGHLAKMRGLREGLARSAPGLRVAGGGYDGFGIPDCIRQGQEAGMAMALE